MRNIHDGYTNRAAKLRKLDEKKVVSVEDIRGADSSSNLKHDVDTAGFVLSALIRWDAHPMTHEVK